MAPVINNDLFHVPGDYWKQSSTERRIGAFPLHYKVAQNTEGSFL